MNRGSTTATLQSPIYLIETVATFEGNEVYSAFKPFASLAGFKKGVAAVDADVLQAQGWGDHGVKYRTYICKDPTWEEFDAASH